MDPIQYHASIPRWFTWSFHHWSKLRWCRRGHSDPESTGVCSFCGQLINERWTQPMTDALGTGATSRGKHHQLREKFILDLAGSVADFLDEDVDPPFDEHIVALAADRLHVRNVIILAGRDNRPILGWLLRRYLRTLVVRRLPPTTDMPSG